MSPNRRYEISPTAMRDIERLDAEDRRRVFDALDRLVADQPRGDVRKLEGTSDEWRLRVGRLRVRFTPGPRAGLISVLRVLPRDRAYRD